MHFTLFANLYWAVGFFLDLALVAVLVARGRWRTFPVFTLWLVFLVLRTALLFSISRHGTRNMYADVYVTGFWIEFCLQLGVIVEIARIVLRPTGTWARDARAQFISGGLAGVAVAALVTWLVRPPPAWSVLYSWQLRGDLFTSLVICELFVVMSLTASRLGLGWRNHVMAVGQGLTVWSTVMVLQTAIESFFGTQRYYVQLEEVGSVTYIGAVCWMILQLWRDEPERRPISSDLQQYILALHRRVEYDLRRLDA